jgi:hypothetical protein
MTISVSTDMSGSHGVLVRQALAHVGHPV